MGIYIGIFLYGIKSICVRKHVELLTYSVFRIPTIFTNIAGLSVYKINFNTIKGNEYIAQSYLDYQNRYRFNKLSH